MQKGFFITGTDTGVGKTHIGAALVATLFQQGVSVQPRKPAESGCKNINGHLQPEDGLKYYYACNKSIPLEVITPYRFEAALAPNQAAELIKQTLLLKQLESAALAKLNMEDYLIIEGAGGIYSPIAHDGLNMDLALNLKLPVILVVADQLGCINHTLLTIEALQNKNINVPAIILNQNDSTLTIDGNLQNIKQYTDIPIFCFQQDKSQASQANQTTIHSLIQTLNIT